MIEINETKEVMEKLKLEGKVKTINSQEEIKSIIEINKMMENLHRDYINKSNNSWIGAGRCYIYQNSN